jgi:hypothetical protein
MMSPPLSQRSSQRCTTASSISSAIGMAKASTSRRMTARDKRRRRTPATESRGPSASHPGSTRLTLPTSVDRMLWRVHGGATARRGGPDRGSASSLRLSKSDVADDDLEAPAQLAARRSTLACTFTSNSSRGRPRSDPTSLAPLVSRRRPSSLTRISRIRRGTAADCYLRTTLIGRICAGQAVCHPLGS